MCGRRLASILHFSTASSPFAIPTTWLIRLLAASHNYQLPDCLVVVTVSSIPVTLLAFRLHHINIYQHPTRWILHPTHSTTPRRTPSFLYPHLESFLRHSSVVVLSPLITFFRGDEIFDCFGSARVRRCCPGWRINV